MRRATVFGLIVLIAALGGSLKACGPFARIASDTSSADGPLDSFITDSSAISCASANSCLAVGTSMQETMQTADAWNGKAWSPIAISLSAGATGGLTGVSCSGRSCLAVGSYIPGSGWTIGFAATWDGRKLRRIPAPPAPAGGEPDDLGGVSCVSAKACITMVDSIMSGRVMIDTWDGSRWTAMRAADPAGVADLLGSISCVSVTYCVFGGTAPNSDPGSKKPLLAFWNGHTIVPMKVPAPAATDVPTDYGPPVIYDVSCVSMTSCAAVGTYLTNSSATAGFGFAEVLSGKTWKETTIAWPGQPSLSTLFGVSCASVKSCVAVGSVASPSGALTAAAVSYNGKTWTRQTDLPVPGHVGQDYLSGVSCLTGNHCVAAGQAGPAQWYSATPLIGSWNGQSWSQVIVK